MCHVQHYYTFQRFKDVPFEGRCAFHDTGDYAAIAAFNGAGDDCNDDSDLGIFVRWATDPRLNELVNLAQNNVRQRQTILTLALEVENSVTGSENLQKQLQELIENPMSSIEEVRVFFNNLAGGAIIDLLVELSTRMGHTAVQAGSALDPDVVRCKTTLRNSMASIIYLHQDIAVVGVFVGRCRSRI